MKVIAEVLRALMYLAFLLAALAVALLCYDLHRVLRDP